MQARCDASSTGPVSLVAPFGKRPCVSEEDEPSAATDSGLLSRAACPRQSDALDQRWHWHRHPVAAIKVFSFDLAIAGESTSALDLLISTQGVTHIHLYAAPWRNTTARLWTSQARHA
jgi:hypothetical protein